MARHWDTKAYRSILSARIVGTKLEVNFADDTSAIVDLQKYVSVSMNRPLAFRIVTNPNEVQIGYEDTQIEIPWLHIRLDSDEKFANHWNERQDEEARRVGSQLKLLRTQRGFPAKEVAERSGLTPQSLSRIENGHHDVSFGTLRKILGAMGASLVDLANVSGDVVSLHTIRQNLEKSGIEWPLLLKRLVPNTLAAQLDSNHGVDRTLASQLSNCLEVVFGIEPRDILEGRIPIVGSFAALGTRFKVARGVSPDRVSIYAVYAHYIAALALQSASGLPPLNIPGGPEEMLTDLQMLGENLTLATAIAYIWSRGIPVVPLADSGAFHGACWRINGRYVIAVKQGNQAHERWLYDLLHELGHICRGHLDAETSAIIEDDEISPFQNKREEMEANQFASHIIFQGVDPDELAQESAEMAGGKVERLKSAVLKTASAHNIAAGSLANYVAFRLQNQGQNWWGAATNLQVDDPDAIAIVRESLYAHVDLNTLNALDRALFERSQIE